MCNDQESLIELFSQVKKQLVEFLRINCIKIARCVCRRSERLAVNMQQNDLFTDEKVIRYLNRLSDYLFTLARYVGQKLGVEEIKWKARI